MAINTFIQAEGNRNKTGFMHKLFYETKYCLHPIYSNFLALISQNMHFGIENEHILFINFPPNLKVGGICYENHCQKRPDGLIGET